LAVVAAVVLLVAGGAGWYVTRHWPAGSPSRPAGGPSKEVRTIQHIVPVPVSTTATPGVTFEVTAGTAIHAAPEVRGTAEYLAALLRPLTGFAVPVRDAPAGDPPAGIALLIGGDKVAEAYRLDITGRSVVIRGGDPAGVFAGVQTLRQLLPLGAPVVLPGGHVTDQPRFAYRGAMLDVSRHFFGVDDVKRYIDHLAELKVNHLHLHLSDDQGWRIQIESWPELTAVGAGTAVGGDAGGFYTQAQYREIVGYARERFITVVPEIDMPGHVNAALASYPELNCDGVARKPYTGTDVGFSSLCVGKEITYRFVDDVVRELAALTPGPYLHIGGDEADATPPADYRAFMNRAQEIVVRHGKTPVAWHQLVTVPGAASVADAVAQFWGSRPAEPEVSAAAATGRKLIMSPANTAYLDMKYTASTELGLKWAGLIEVRDAYDWDPATRLDGVPPESILGVEAPLWTETVRTMADIEFLALPRLAAIAEIGWSPASARTWDDFRARLAALGQRWSADGVNFYRSPQVDWRD
jgi:hexosaminidase